MNLIADPVAFPGLELVFLAPAASMAPPHMLRATANPAWHKRLLAEMQRLRGAVYLEDGAIRHTQLTEDGRHRLAADERSWHILAVERSGAVRACVRYLSHPSSVRFEELETRRSALASTREWGHKLRRAVECEIGQAQRHGLSYVEVGGWALAKRWRHTTLALRIILQTYGLAEVLGGCLSLSTATARHGSSAILRRTGARLLETGGHEIPSYFDPQYGCWMEMLRFESRSPATKYAPMVRRAAEGLCGAPVICARQDAPVRPSGNWTGFELPGRGADRAASYEYALA